MNSSRLNLLIAAVLFLSPAHAQDSASKIAAVLSAIVGVEAQIPGDARTAATLSTERSGTGVVIDSEGLVVTIGYLILEAADVELLLADGQRVAAKVIAYDHDSGLGLLRALQPLAATPMELGDSSALKVSDPVLAIGFGGPSAVRPASVVARRLFAGYWEYLLEDAIFTAPPHPSHSGAALVGPQGELLGIGSLVVNDALDDGQQILPGNMFVPINVLKPIFGDLLASGRSAAPSRPWLGLYPQEYQRYVFVGRLAEDGPAAQAGLQVGELIVAVDGQPVSDMVELYRALWAQGEAGTPIALSVLRDGQLVEVTVTSDDRYNWLRLNPSF